MHLAPAIGTRLLRSEQRHGSPPLTSVLDSTSVVSRVNNAEGVEMRLYHGMPVRGISKMLIMTREEG